MRGLNQRKLEQSFGQYLNLQNGAQYSLSNNGNLHFHWADWGETCQFMMDRKNQKQEAFSLWLQALDQSLDHLKQYPVWLRNKQEFIKSSLFEIYNSYMDPKMQTAWFENPSCTVLISTVSDNGPYVPLNSMRWFVKEIYLNFVYKRILDNRLPNRDFRLRFEQSINCEYVYPNFSHDESIELLQLTKKGLLLKFTQNQLDSKLESLQEIHLFFNDKYFNEINGKTISSRVEQFSDKVKMILAKHYKSGYFVLTKSHLLDQLKRQKANKRLDQIYIHLLIPYENLKSPYGHTNLGDKLLNLIHGAEDLMGQKLKNVA